MIIKVQPFQAALFLLLFSISTTLSIAQGQPDDATKNISIRPSTLSFNLLNGETASKKISVTNSTDRKIQFRIYLSDWMRDSIGGHAYYTPDTLEVSCAKWVQFDKTFLEVESGQTGEFNVKVEMPEDPEAVNRMRWTMVFVETIEEKMSPDNEKGITSIVNNKMRVGVHVYQTPPTLNKKEVQILRFSSIQDSVNQYKMICKNTGDIQINCKSYMELSSLSTSEKYRIEGRVFPIFPEQERMVTFQLPADLTAGKYNAVAAIDAGDDVALEIAQAIITVK